MLQKYNVMLQKYNFRRDLTLVLALWIGNIFVGNCYETSAIRSIKAMPIAAERLQIDISAADGSSPIWDLSGTGSTGNDFTITIVETTDGARSMIMPWRWRNGEVRNHQRYDYVVHGDSMLRVVTERQNVRCASLPGMIDHIASGCGATGEFTMEGRVDQYYYLRGSGVADLEASVKGKLIISVGDTLCDVSYSHLRVSTRWITTRDSLASTDQMPDSTVNHTVIDMHRFYANDDSAHLPVAAIESKTTWRSDMPEGKHTDTFAWVRIDNNDAIEDNPSHNQLSASSLTYRANCLEVEAESESMMMLVISDTGGRVWLTRLVVAGDQVDLSGLPQGEYAARITGDDIEPSSLLIEVRAD